MNNIPEQLLNGSLWPLASSLHEFKSDTLADVYNDLDKLGMLNPVGTGLIEDIPYLKDKDISKLYPITKIPRLIQGATGYYYLRKLSRSERRAYLKAVKAENRNLIPLKDWLSSPFKDMDDFICCSFGWSDTEQGFEFWDKISTRARWWNKPIVNI